MFKSLPSPSLRMNVDRETDFDTSYAVFGTPPFDRETDFDTPDAVFGTPPFE